MLGEQLGQPVDAVDGDRTLPGQVVQPDVVELHLVGRDPEPVGEATLEADGDVAQPDRAVTLLQQRPGDDADRVGEVDDPRVGCRRADPLGDVEDDRHGAQRLGEPAGAGGLLADAAALQRPGLVLVPGGLTADPQLQEDGVDAVERRLQVGRW